MRQHLVEVLVEDPSDLASGLGVPRVDRGAGAGSLLQHGAVGQGRLPEQVAVSERKLGHAGSGARTMSVGRG